MTTSTDLYFKADEAADLLGVSRATLYAYVSRKGIRTERVPGARERLYWKADVLAAKAGRGGPARPAILEGIRTESALTFISETGPYYRGSSAIALAEAHSVEEVAALLWGVAPEAAFTARLPNLPENYAALMSLIAGASAVDRSTVIMPFLEAANPRSFDLSPAGMAATGADLLRVLASILVRDAQPSVEPLHAYIAGKLGVTPAWGDTIRRLLILSMDHGFEPGTYAVRAVSSVGVSPYRSALAGLAIASGRRTRFGRFDGLARLLAEIVASPDPASLIVGRLREGEELPGFGYEIYPGGDPRAAAMFRQLDTVCGADEDYCRVLKAVATVEDLRGLKPDFALVSMFINGRIGLEARDSLFLLGRTVGWIAHSIEQFQTGAAHRPASAYIGRLPTAAA